jgi:hypothetical protein
LPKYDRESVSMREKSLRAVYAVIAGLLALLVVLLPLGRGAVHGATAHAHISLAEASTAHAHASTVDPHGDHGVAAGMAEAGAPCEGTHTAGHHGPGHASQNADCCGMGMCHAVQLSDAVFIASPVGAGEALRPALAQRLAASGLARPEEPPRTL